ncbi:hypothetical protein PIB30_005835 [Stylosanthes scabra]|uniref:Uncharacterized protein n=1 Tax=Stylosanthes scabra TaxID=79078 RepID=A0ABU6Z2P4_9FABA|nr:hypothetical protein [Stylosanthes scabra]
MVESEGGRDADNEGLMDFCEEYDSDCEEDEANQGRENEDKWKKEMQSNEEKFYINTISDIKKDEEELPAKCEDPDLGPLKKSKEVFSTADTSIMSIAGIADNVLVTIGKLTIPADFHILEPTPKEKKGKPQEDEEEELEESCYEEQKSQKKGPDKTYEKPPAEYPSVTGMLEEIEQIPCHNKGDDAHLGRNNSK